MARVVSDFGRKGNVKRRSDALRVLEFIQSRGKATSIEIGQAFPDIEPSMRGAITSRLRREGLISKRSVTIDRKQTIEWRVS